MIQGVIHISKPQPWWVGGSIDGLVKLFHEYLDTNWADGEPHGWPMYLFIIEEEIGIFETKL